ncbi:MAG: CsgE family curli-type amyloid fiber assembly protein [Cyclobacteriaceae bacterium]
MFGIVVLFSTFPCSAQVSSSDADSSNTQTKTAAYLNRLITETTEEVLRKSSYVDDLEISELIVNAMISKHGNDFFDYFVSGFDWPDIEGSFIIVISERPFRTNTTFIEIKVNDLEVFKTVLQPRNTYLEELAAYTQATTAKYILNYHQIMSDLDGADRSGTGIY